MTNGFFHRFQVFAKRVSTRSGAEYLVGKEELHSLSVPKLRDWFLAERTDVFRVIHHLLLSAFPFLKENGLCTGESRSDVRGGILG